MAQDEQSLRELEDFPSFPEAFPDYNNNAETSAGGLPGQGTLNMEPDGSDGRLVAGHKRPREDPTVDGPAHLRDNQPSPSPDVSSYLNGGEASASEQYSGGPSMHPTDGPAAGRMELPGGKKPKIVHSFAAEEEVEESMQPEWRACKQLFEASLLPRHMKPNNCQLPTPEYWKRLLEEKKIRKCPVITTTIILSRNCTWSRWADSRPAPQSRQPGPHPRERRCRQDPQLSRHLSPQPACGFFAGVHVYLGTHPRRALALTSFHVFRV
jgi:hypothetical protein